MITALWQSFYLAPLYRLVQRWRGRALVYLGLILALCWAPSIIKMHQTMNFLFQRAETDVLPKLPELHFENGQVHTTENRPYLYRFGKGAQNVIAIIDTSGKYTTLEGQEAQMLLTKDHFFVRQTKTGELRSYDLSKSKARPITLDQALLQRWLTLLRRWVLVAVSVGVYVMSYLKRLFQAFFMALAGLLVSSLIESDLDLGELFSLAIVAMTPAMILETLLALAGKSFRFQWILWGLLITAYFLFAINAASDKLAETSEEISS